MIGYFLEELIWPMEGSLEEGYRAFIAQVGYVILQRPRLPSGNQV